MKTFIPMNYLAPKFITVLSKNGDRSVVYFLGHTCAVFSLDAILTA